MTASPQQSAATFFFCGSAIDDFGLTPIQFSIMFHLKRRAGKTGKAKCGIRGIARTCRVNTETVVGAIRALENQKIIECKREPKRTTTYCVNPFAAWQKPLSASEQIRNSSCIPKPNRSRTKTVRKGVANLYPRTESNCTDLGNEMNSYKGIPSKAREGSRFAVAKKEAGENSPQFLSDAYFKEASHRLKRSERQLRELVRVAQRKCGQQYPDGGPMGQAYFEKFVDREPLPTPELECYKERRDQEDAEAGEHRRENPRPPDNIVNIPLASSVCSSQTSHGQTPRLFEDRYRHHVSFLPKTGY
jgi:hypothetical protein